MKLFTKKTFACFFLIFLAIITILIINSKQSYALELSAPTIESFEETGNDGVLKLTFSSNNTGSDYSYEIINTTINESNNVSGSTNFYVFQGLLPNIKYEVIMRTCDKSYTCSDWTEPVSAYVTSSSNNTEFTVPISTLSSVTALNNNSVKLSYSVTGNTTGVEIYNITTGNSIKTMNKMDYIVTGLKANTTYKFKIRGYYANNNSVYSNYSNEISTFTYNADKINSMKQYSKITVLKTYKKSNLKKIATVKTGKYSVPQAFCDTGSNYVVQFGSVNHKNGNVQLASYKKSGKKVKESSSFNGGHGNGITCDNNLTKIYSVKSGSSTVCNIFNKTSLKKEKSFNLPVKAGGIAYDQSNNSFYVKRSGYIYILDSNFKLIKKVKVKRTVISQDIGGYHGLIFHIIMKKNGDNYIDFYRVSDGAYVGSYRLKLYELESVFVDNGYLVLLVNNKGPSDGIYRSKVKISIP